MSVTTPPAFASPTGAPTPAVPSAIGSYRVTGVLGEGGMGVVYAAEQVEPIQRRVAIKLVRAAVHSSNVVARFAAERQALAVMEHPSIAAVYDAGTAADGSSYFVMEYVDGVPIAQYCDEHRLGTRARLALFLPICRAVQHAHQKGVIHRDLKPSNVLVTEQGGEPLPKVIDFGIAKAVDRHLTSATLATTFGVVVGTPAYMSPEQAEGAGTDVDTRTDVYSLGVMLYELLAGSLPLDPAEVGLVTFITRLIAGLTVVKPPSDRVADRATEVHVAALRGTEPAALSRELRGDIDAIVLKAMATERERRYATAQELALDIERFLRNEPVEARAPSAAYRFRKLVRRHPAATALVASAALSLVALSTVMTVQARRIERARAVAERRRTQAEELISYMVGDLRQRLEPIGKLDILDDAGARALAYFAAVPPAELSDAELYRRSQALGQIGQVRMTGGDLARAMPAFRSSLAQARDLAARDPSNADWQVQLGGAHFWVGYTYFQQGALDSALAQFAPYLDITRRLVARDSTRDAWQLELSYAYSNIGSVKEAQGDLRGALDAFRYTLGVKRRLLARDPTNASLRTDVADTENTVARALERLAELDSARAHYDAELALKRDALARDSADMTRRHALATALSAAASNAEARGDVARARALFDSAWTEQRRLARHDTANAEWARNEAVAALRLGRIDVAAGRLTNGVALIDAARARVAALARRDSTNADLRQLLGRVDVDRAVAFDARGNPAAAHQATRSALTLLAPLATAPDASRALRLELARAEQVDAELYAREGRVADARAAATRALAALGDPPATEDLRAAAVRARTLVTLGRTADAAPVLARLRRAGYREPGFAAER